MRLNAWFPSVQIGNDPKAIRDWAQAAEDLGYEYIEVPDHVLAQLREMVGRPGMMHSTHSMKPLPQWHI